MAYGRNDDVYSSVQWREDKQATNSKSFGWEDGCCTYPKIYKRSGLRGQAFKLVTTNVQDLERWHDCELYNFLSQRMRGTVVVTYDVWKD